MGRKIMNAECAVVPDKVLGKNMKRFICRMLPFVIVFIITACGASQSEQGSERQTQASSTAKVDGENQPEPEAEKEGTQFRKNDNEIGEEDNTEMRMRVQVEDSTFTATLEDNDAVRALLEMMEKEPVIIRMSDYSGFEKVGALGKNLPANNSQTTTAAGDIVLYQGNQIVMFYGSNSWSYTRLGRIDDLTGWEEALGKGDVTVAFSLKD